MQDTEVACQSYPAMIGDVEHADDVASIMTESNTGSVIVEFVPAIAVEGYYVKRRHVIWCFTLGTFLLTASVVGIVLGFSNQQSTGSTTEPLLSTTFTMPSLIEKLAMSLSNVTQQILQDELPHDGEDVANWYLDECWNHSEVLQPQSPQGKAWKWLLSQPTLESQSVTDATLLFALATLFYSTNGSNWKNNTNWLSEATVCEWWSRSISDPVSYGTHTSSCNEEGFRHLDLSSNGLVGEIPQELALVTTLTRVKLGANSLNGQVSAKVWESWQNVVTLELFSNNLTGSLPSELGLMTDTMYMRINDNRFSGSLISDLGRMSALKIFNANDNLFSGTIPSALGGLKRLEHLVLSNNTLTGTIPPQILGMQSTRQLDVGMNRLTGTLSSEIASSDHLSYFRASHNLLNGTIPIHLSRLTDLMTISLNTNRLSGSLPRQLSKMAGLRALDVSDNRVSGSLPFEFGNLSQLSDLRIFDTRMSGSIPESVCKHFAQLDATNNIVIECSNVQCDCNCTCNAPI